MFVTFVQNEFQKLSAARSVDQRLECYDTEQEHTHFLFYFYCRRTLGPHGRYGDAMATAMAMAAPPYLPEVHDPNTKYLSLFLFFISRKQTGTCPAKFPSTFDVSKRECTCTRVALALELLPSLRNPANQRVHLQHHCLIAVPETLLQVAQKQKKKRGRRYHIWYTVTQCQV